jgi:2-keto-4-pentenoate hydratase/2-oxohepta-3-ene-1,7-dioic acid hydratase in catechol pathway
MSAAEGNRPRWSGRGFEIWFFVVLVPGQGAALWVRMTRFADGSGGDSRVWAVVASDGAITAGRAIFPLADLSVTDDEAGAPCVRVGGAELGDGFARGSCGMIRWSLQFTGGEAAARRLPHVPEFVPLGTRSHHTCAEGQVTGFVETGGRRVALDGGSLTQMHIWGQRRVEWLRWAWVPQFAGGGALELTAVAPRAGRRHLCALWARLGEGPAAEVIDNTGLLAAARGRVRAIRPGVLHHVGPASGGRRLVLRVWAAAATFAGWDYRQTGGGDLHVAQSDLAHCELEIYRRAGFGWRPERRLRSTCAALEFHGPEAFEQFDYVPWEAREVAVARRDGRSAARGPESPAPAGTWIDTPRPARIVALGLTYRAHAEETASGPDPVVFSIDPAAWTAGDGELLRPSSAQLLATAAALDPRLPAELAGFGFLPAMLDYEVELGLLLLGGLDDIARLDEFAAGGEVALVVANDVTARSLQILGEGQRDRLAYWSAAKSLPGFMPTTARAFVPARFELDVWPALRLQTRVNGELRQDADVALLQETPRQLLTRVRERCGPLPPGTLVLTGTPAGVAFSVPAWKRELGERLLDRVGKLRAALGGYTAGTAFLRPGDVVEVRAGFLGGFVRSVESKE